ncbi:MAG: DUF6048 family protein [Cyclobacteriaceae bacterium]
MLRHTSKYILCLIVWLSGETCLAQTDSLAVPQPKINAVDSLHDSPVNAFNIDSLGLITSDSLEVSMSDSLGTDSLRSMVEQRRRKPIDTIDYPLISAVSIYFDYPKLFSFFTDYENKAEVGLELQIFKRIYARGEFGRTRIRPDNFYKNVGYEVSGNYFRSGLAYRGTIGAKSNLALGVMYGKSAFEDRGSVQIEGQSGLFDPLNQDFERTELSGDWFELFIGTESNLGNNIYLGFTFRVRKLNTYDQFDELDVFAVPGYGRTFDNSIPALNMYIKYRIPFY